MDSSNLSRLRQEQDRAIHDTDLEIDKWQKFKSDYEALNQRLKTLPDKVSHDVMVPFGNLAFMPGRLVHTNEIMVLLGDNWFVERSAKQAAEIVSRRLSSVKESLSKLEDQRKLLTPRQVFTQELQDIAQGSSDVKEIIEEYDSDAEKEWRVQHRKNVRVYREKLREEEKTENTSREATLVALKSDEDLWARLDELEKREAERQELDGDDSGEDVKPENVGKVSSNRCVSWADRDRPEESDPESDDVKSSTSASDYDTDTEDETVCRQMSRITFSHSDQRKSSSPENTQEFDHTSGDSVPNIKSPSDVYKYFVEVNKPKSILKQKKVKHKVEEERKYAEQQRQDSKSKEQAFTGTVIEKATTPAVITDTSPPTAPVTTSSASVPATQPTRPVSRFKAQRQQRGANR